MYILEPPWSGLSVVAPRVDLWPLLRAAGLIDADTGCEQLPLGLSARLGFDPSGLRQAGLSAAAVRTVTETGAWSARPHVRFLRAGSTGWPAPLWELPFGPVALAIEGERSLLWRPCVGVVGARACTPYGQEWAGRLAGAIVGAGGVVVSGLAAGIDSAAHAAAEGATIAVLGQGIDAPMPAWQQRARDRILDRGGLVVSELPPQARATAFTFPIRNRIIAGLSRAVAVVEAGVRSGARNTGSHALAYGREVLALPGPLGAAASEGCLDLIEQGATVIRGVGTVLEAGGLHGPRADEPCSPGPLGALWRALEQPSTTDDLAERLGVPHATVAEALGMLELTGRAIRLPGARYQARPLASSSSSTGPAPRSRAPRGGFPGDDAGPWASRR